MKTGKRALHISASDSSLAAPRLASHDAEDREPIDRSQVYVNRQVRALRLGQQLRLSVSVDASGWLRDEVEVVYHRARHGGIAPFFVRVGDHTRDGEVLGENGVHARCRQYNAVIDRLHQLTAKLTTMVRTGEVVLVPGSATAYAYLQLTHLDHLIAWRQTTYMGHGVVRLHQLAQEIDFFSRYDAQLAPIVEQAECTAGELPTAAFPQAAAVTSSQAAGRWSRWFRWPSAERSSRRGGRAP